MRRLLVCALALFCIDPALAEGRKPPLPPGRDPGGVAIALLTTGIDYTLPEVAQVLARDGEGELIGRDIADDDNRPRAVELEARANWGGDGTALAKALGSPGRRLVPVRISPGDPISLARAVAFVAQTPARIVVVPMWSAAKSDWEPFRQAAVRFRDLLFILAAGDEGRDIDAEPVWPAAFGLANALVVTAPLGRARSAKDAPNGGDKLVDALVSSTPGAAEAATSPPHTTSLAALLAADALAGCWPRLVSAFKGEALKAALLAEAAKAWPTAKKPIIERCIDPRAAGRKGDGGEQSRPR